MRLLELETRHWRGLSLSLEALSPRLNLVLGPNEAGKSRLFEAIRFALFESHKGTAQHKQRLQSWQSSDAPFVRLAFEVDGHRYELQKQFLKGTMAQLSGGGATVRGEDAETQLRVLLGTRPGTNRGPSPQDLGIWPLLMVAQGDSRRGTGEDLNEDGRARLHERLSQEIGVAAISQQGQRLMERIEKEYSRYYTPTGQEAAPLRNARKAVSDADGKYQQALATHQSRERTAAELEQARGDLASMAVRFEKAKRDADDVEARASAAQQAAAQLTAAQGILNTAIATASSAEREWQARQEVDQAIQRLSEEAAKLQSQIDALDSHQSALEAQAQVAQQRVSSAEQAHRRASTALDTVRRERLRRDLTARKEELRAKSADLERIDRELAEAQRARALEPSVSAQTIARLQELEQAAHTAAAHLHGAAASVIVTLRQALAVDGTPYPAGTRLPFDIVENRTLILGDVATIDIQPGRGTLDKLRDAKTAADSALTQALQDCGVPSVPEARAVHERRARLDQQIDQLKVQAKATWPKTTDELRDELLRVDAELERLGPESPVEETEETLQTALTAAETELNTARAARDAANDAVTQARSDGVARRAARQSKVVEHEHLTRLYADRPTAEELAEKHAETVRSRGQAQQALQDRQRTFQDLGGEEAARDAKRLSQAKETLARGLQDAQRQVDQLTGTLQATLGAATYEGVQEADAALQHERNQLLRLERQAAAARRLHEVLGEERKRVVERLTAPVMQRMKPYLSNLFPGCDLDMGEELAMAGLRSETLREPFEELSGGAQEQLALLTRIGLAEVLSGEDTLPIVLDDSLVNTDPERIRQIHRVLYRAADRLQVLLFSCHDVLFDGLGAEQVFRLHGGRNGD